MNSAVESARMLDILIPNGGDLVTVSEGYFDESYEDNAPRILCVAGYVFSKSGALEFGRLWSRYLRSKGLPYFHANEAAGRDGVFDGWTDDQIDVVSRKLISLTKEYSDFGVAVTVDQDEYADICTGNEMFPPPYTYALTNCLYQIAHWRVAARKVSPTAFYFEQGHKHANDANQFLTFMLRSDDLPGRLGYRAHAFVPKETPQVQPGDLLAWLWRQYIWRAIKGSKYPTRKDLLALKRTQDSFVHFDRSRLEKFRDSILSHAPAAQAYVREMAQRSGMSPKDVEEIANWSPNYRDSRY